MRVWRVYDIYHNMIANEYAIAYLDSKISFSRVSAHSID